MSKYPFIKQEGLKDCGAVSLLMIIKYYNGFIPLEKLRELTKTTRSGVNAYNLCEAAKQVGFEASGLKLTINDLKGILPCIAHVTINNYDHYIVIYEVNYKKKYLIIADPASKLKKITFEYFEEIWNNIVIKLYPVRTIPIENNDSLIKSALKYLKNYKKLLFQVFLYSIIITIFSCLSSLYFRTLIDNLNTSKNYITLIFIIFLIIEVIKNINNFFRNKLVIYLNQKIDMNMTSDIYNKIIDLPYQYYRNRTTGEILSRFNDLNIVRDTFTKIIINLFTDLPLLITTLIIIFIVNFKLSLIVLSLALVYLFIVLILTPIINNYINNIQIEKANSTSLMVESVSGFETIKNLNVEHKFKTRFIEKYYKLLNTLFSFDNLVNIKEIISNSVFSLGIIIILFLGSLNILDKTFSVGTLIMFYSLSIYFTDSFKNIVSLDINFKEARSAFRRIMEIFIDKKEEQNILSINECNITINNLTYSYNNTTVLNKVNLKINKGEKVLITGVSGSGKSTLLKILKSYYEIDNNKVFIDDIDINYYDKRDINENIVYISQNEILFSDSILNNLCLYEIKDIIEVVKTCEIDKIMNKRNINYNYVLEENGFNFSGGEKQRLILGRALLNDFKVLLIDEGLSQMDINLERRILKRLFLKYKDKTIIIVSHRMNNIDLYDHHIEIDNGNIVKDVGKNE